MNPLDAFQGKLEEIKRDVAIRVETLLLRQNMAVALSRLKDIDPDRSAQYSVAQDELK